MKLELKNRIMKCLVECSTICSRDVDVDADRQQKIRSVSNMDIEKNGKDQPA